MSGAPRRVLCVACKGTGKVGRKTCVLCKGRGVTDERTKEGKPKS